MIETQTKKLKQIQALIDETKEKYTYKISENQHINVFKLEPSDKIIFAYDYYTIAGEISILELLKQIPEENQELIRTIIQFIVTQRLIRPLPNITYEYSHCFSDYDAIGLRTKTMSVSSIAKEYNPQNWLELFDENAIFEESKTKHPAYRIFPDSQGKKIKFDKDLATKVKLAIINEGIAPARCIVEGAYPHVARGTFQEYTDKIKRKTL